MSVPIAVVSFGHKRHARLMCDFVTRLEPSVMSFDLCSMLTDPLYDDCVNDHEDGSHAKTIVAVFGQQGFARAVSVTLAKALWLAHSLGRGVVIAGGCNGGFHRADTWGRTVVDSFNALMVGPVGRLVNAQHFPMQTKSPREAKHILNTAQNWVAMPWTIANPTFPTYAEHETKARQSSHDTFLQIQWDVRFLNTDKEEQIKLAKVHRAMRKEKEKESNKQET